jgi:hypothetical protein
MSGAEQSSLDIGPTSPDGRTSRRFLWPTPTAQNIAEGMTVERWEEWTEEMKARHHNGNGHGRSLSVEVRRSISSAEGSLASPSPSPASGEDRMTSDGSGPSSLGSFAYYDPDTSSWRTFQVSLLEEWATYSETWPRAGTTVSGTASRRQPSVPLISVTGSSSWPTPTVADLFTDKLESSQQSEGSRHSVNLSQAVTWNGYEKRLPTPTASDGKAGTPLPIAIYRTPQARDGDQRGPSSPERRVEQGHSVSLHDQVGGQLNPTWVEWLMGFPLGWTDLEGSETPSSPRSLSGSDEG